MNEEGEFALAVHETEPRFLMVVRTPEGAVEADLSMEQMTAMHEAIGAALAEVKARTS